MRAGQQTSNNPIPAVCRCLRFIVGLPLVYAGVILLALHFFLRLDSNALLLTALAAEVIGIVGHYLKVRL